MLTDRFDEALAYASRLHREQRRKGTDIPYVAHLLGVASIALENGADEDQAIAALLHDAVEDQGGLPRLREIRARFGDHVAEMVEHCTDAVVEPKPQWRPRKEAYIASLASKPEASLQVSLADKTHNAGAIIADLATHGEALWDRFTGGRDGSLWYYESLAQAFTDRIPGPPTDRFAALVGQMRAASELAAASVIIGQFEGGWLTQTAEQPRKNDRIEEYLDEHVLDATGASGRETIVLSTGMVGRDCRIRCIVRGDRHQMQGADFFEAFTRLRRQILEPMGLIPCCYGASLGVWPSGMARSMGLGLQAYRIEVGEAAGELVNIFDTGDDVMPATVDAQERYAKRWLASPHD